MKEPLFQVEIHIAAAHADAVFEEDVVEEGEVPFHHVKAIFLCIVC